MSDIKQRTMDWYVNGPRDFYRRYVDRFWQRAGLVAISGDQGFMDMDPLPLGHAEIDQDNLDATHRTFMRIVKKYE